MAMYARKTPASALDPDFGYKVEETSLTTVTHLICGSWFTCPEEGTAESITAYVRGYGVYSATVKGAIYRRSDNSFVGETEERTLTLGNTLQWATWKFLLKPKLENIDYYLVLWATNPFYIAHATEIGKGGEQTIVYGAFPDPWSPSLTDRKHCIYCTYTVGVPPPTHILRVESTPISVPVTLNGASLGNTPVSATVEEGDHTVEVPSEVIA